MEMDRRIIESFEINFIKKNTVQNKRVILYGLGKSSETIINAFPNCRIEGLLDGFQSDGERYGKPIRKLTELNGPEYCIIITARKASQKIIYQRIAEYCKREEIKVFNLDGVELTANTPAFQKEHSYFEINLDEVKEKIKTYDYISFDLFDTLLTRKVLYPELIFNLVAKRAGCLTIDFANERVKAEKALSIEGIPNLHKIYDELQKNTKISTLEKKRLYELEIEIEQEMLIPRKAVVQLMEYAFDLNKKVTIISDMYMGKELLMDILKQNGITKYHELLVSSEYGTDKEHDLYQRYILSEGCGNYLHIGDNEYTDGDCAQRFGIDSYLIKSPREMMELINNPKINQCILRNEWNTVWMAGLYASRVFNDPFILYHSNGRPVIKSAYDFGFDYIGPMVTQFVLWLVQQVNKYHITNIIFISRDGYLVKKLYDYYRDLMNREKCSGLPKSTYILTSRTALTALSMDTEEKIQYAATCSFDGSNQELLKRRFFLDEESIIEEKNYQDRAEYVLAHKVHIFNKAKELKVNYLRYLFDFDYIMKEQNIAIFDFVSTGTCQMYLEELLEKRLLGLYYKRVYEDYEPKKNLNIRDYVKDTNCNIDSVEENYFWLESVIKEPRPSILSVDHNANPIFAKEKRTKDVLNRIQAAQQGIEDFFKEYVKLSLENQEMDSFHNEWVQLLVEMTGDEFTIKEYPEFLKDIRDEFCNRKVN